jgi:hypothetical protein
LLRRTTNFDTIKDFEGVQNDRLMGGDSFAWRINELFPGLEFDLLSLKNFIFLAMDFYGNDLQ